MGIEWALVPAPEYIETDEQARGLLRLATRKVEEDPSDFIGFDTETHAKHLPFKVGTKKPLDWMNDTVLFWSLSFRTGDTYRRWCLQQQHFQYFAGLLENPNAQLVAWNAKYDAHVSWNSGIDLWQSNLIDALVLAHMYDENRYDHGLKSCAADYCGLHMTPYKALFDVDVHGNKAVEFKTSLLDLPIEKVVDYASYDAYACLRTAEWLMEQLQAIHIDTSGTTYWDYFLNMERDVTRVLWRMERRGMRIDIDAMKEKLPVIDKEIADLERDIARECGRPDINMDSTKQLAQLFFGEKVDGGMGLKPIKMTKGGERGPQPSVDKEVMGVLAESGIEIADKIVRCRSLKKTRSTYMTTLIDLASYYADGRIHPNFNQMGARTGRLSATVPNSMNMPRPGEDAWGIREAFVAEEGKKLLVSDWEQVEMRIMADRSGDKNMIGAIIDGKDLHSFTVAEMNPDVDYEEVAAAKKADKPNDRQVFLVKMRQDNKGVGFGVIYGAGAPTISVKIEISDADIQRKLDEMDDRKFNRELKYKLKRNPLLSEEKAMIQMGRERVAQEKIDAYFSVFPSVKHFMDRIPEECRWSKDHDIYGNPDPKEWGFVQTLTGRLRRLTDIDHGNRSFRGHAEREAVNSIIQGTAADLAKAAMLRIEDNEELTWLGVRLLNQVHDELVMEVPEENAELAAPIVRECMEHPFGEGDEALCVPIPVDLKIVDRWSQAK